MEAKYSTYTHRQGKKVRRPELGIRMLKNDKGIWKVGKQVEEVINEYSRNMWGRREELGEEILTQEEWKRVNPGTGKVTGILNKELKLEELNRAIGKLKKGKTPGEDMITNEIFINMEREERTKLLKLLEQCRKESKFPEGWKETELRWIYKKADPSKIANYRPIALTDTLYKIYTRMMTERLEEALETFGILTELQNGSRSDRSCMGAIMVMNILMARRLRRNEERPFYVAYIDISKAYDTVSHERLWEILEESGIEGTWVENLKELYKGNFIRSMTPEGKTRAIEMKRGIRQGCPLSPLLFALYTNPIAIAMERANVRKGVEPAMLMYADDMVVWGETEEEVKEKLQIATETMEKLGLQISLEKTELQHNKWVEPSREDESLEIKTKAGVRQIKYQDPRKALRYLGAWTTTNMETEKGLEILKDKMKERLDRIRGCRACPSTKVNLIKSKVVSVWNYTTAVQTIDYKDIMEWEQEFYEAITTGDLRRERKDMVYEARERAGLGMTKLTEEYEKTD